MTITSIVISVCAALCLLDIAIVWALIRQGRDGE
jgi:hypothetical protein